MTQHDATPPLFCGRTRIGRASVVPGAILIALLLGCGTLQVENHVQLQNDTSRDLRATADFGEGHGTVGVPAGAHIDFSSDEPFAVEVRLPDGSTRRVQSGKYEAPNIRVVEGTSPVTVYVNHRR